MYQPQKTQLLQLGFHATYGHIPKYSECDALSSKFSATGRFLLKTHTGIYNRPAYHSNTLGWHQGQLPH